MKPRYILGIDPGQDQSAYLFYDTKLKRPLINAEAPAGWIKPLCITDNEGLPRILFGGKDTNYFLAVEFPAYFGKNMHAGKSIFDTCYWAGRFVEAWGGEFVLLYRKTIVTHICGSATAGDPDVRRALIDRYGGDAKAIGGVRCRKCKGKGWFGAGRPTCPRCKGGMWEHPPGPLSGVKDDIWAALAVAITAAERGE